MVIGQPVRCESQRQVAECRNPAAEEEGDEILAAEPPDEFRGVEDGGRQDEEGEDAQCGWQSAEERGKEIRPSTREHSSPPGDIESVDRHRTDHADLDGLKDAQRRLDLGNVIRVPQRLRGRTGGDEHDEQRGAAEEPRYPVVDQAGVFSRCAGCDRPADPIDSPRRGVVYGDRPEDEHDDCEADDRRHAPDLEQQILDGRDEDQRRGTQKHADQGDPAVPQPDANAVEERVGRPADHGRRRRTPLQGSGNRCLCRHRRFTSLKERHSVAGEAARSRLGIAGRPRLVTEPCGAWPDSPARGLA